MDSHTLLLGSEVVQCEVEADDYETCVVEAMSRFKTFVPEAAVQREREEAKPGDWYVGGTMGGVSLGGTRMCLTVVFCRADWGG